MNLNNNELSFNVVLNKIGFPVKFEDYRATYRYDANYKQVLEFEKELKINLKKTYYDIYETIMRNQNIFDSEVYLFHVGKLLEKDYINSKRAEIIGRVFEPKVIINPKSNKPMKSSIDFFHSMLKQIDVVDISINSKNKELIVESSQVLVGNSTIIHNQSSRYAQAKQLS